MRLTFVDECGSATRRRLLLAATSHALIGVALCAHAQKTMIYRIGYLHPTDAQDFATGAPDPCHAAFRRALESFGYIVGVNTFD